MTAEASYWRLLGQPEDVSELPVRELVSRMGEDDRARFMGALADLRTGRRNHFDLRYRVHHPDGRTLWVQQRGQLEDQAGCRQIAGTYADISDLLDAFESRQAQTPCDKLTGVMERSGILRAAQEARENASSGGSGFSVALVDLDFFREINQRHGQAVGDALLAGICEQLRSYCNTLDMTLGRWSGDQFLVVAPGRDEDETRQHLDQIRSLLALKPATLANNRIPVTLSVGVAGSTATAEPCEALIQRAEAALIQAKHGGRNRVCASENSLDRHGVSIAVTVQDAVKSARIASALQPLIRLKDRRFVAEEAFARILQHNGRTLNAAAFIDTATQFGLLHRIDRYLFNAACERILNPPECSRDGNRARPIFVHCSADLFDNPAALAAMAEQLEQNPLQDHACPVMILNAELVGNACKKVAHLLGPLLEHGCRVAIADDTGKMSLNRAIPQLPVHYLSFDPVLIQSALESPGSFRRLSEARRTACDLGVTTIAKRIQNQQTLDFVERLGFDWGQGYLLAVPRNPAWSVSAAGIDAESARKGASFVEEEH